MLVRAFFLLVVAATARAQVPAAPRPIPPPGIAIPDAVREELAAGAAALGREIDALRVDLKAKPELLALLPDVQVFHKAVDWALRYGEFFDPKHVAAAKAQLALGLQRAKELRAGEPSWNAATGLVVRGYISKIDGSVQPYGLVIPEDWKPADQTPRRLDVWFRGRAEKATELAFIEDRLKNKGEFVPAGAFVLHPFGRYCNANKFAGEVDLFEALEHARQYYPIDYDRLVVRGFSMGGAAAWQFATHHAGMWAAAAPGAGFAETAEFHKVFAPGKEPPPWWEQVLWRWYDSTTMAANLANVPTIAYSGELDGQKQAADIMLRFAEKEGVTIPHIIGPQTGHNYHSASKSKIEEFMTKAFEKEHKRFPDELRFTTCSLIYPTAVWGGANRLYIEALDRQWERADLVARTEGGGRVIVRTNNINRFTLWSVPGALLEPTGAELKDGLRIILDEQAFDAPSPFWTPTFRKQEDKWVVFEGWDRSRVEKKPGLCGPIDHAFMSSFIVVKPTGKPLNETTGAWINAELEHASEFWRRVFRGDAPVKDDTAVIDADLSNSHLVLWGDPSSNAVLKRLAEKLPLKWTEQTLEFNGVKYDAAHHAPILIFPNPLNPQKYVVLNSGPTFREQALLNNSDQTPKLPDWAIIDLRTPPGPKWPGLVVDAGFFNEQWALSK